MESITLETMHKDVESLKKSLEEMKIYLEDCFLTVEEETNFERARDELEKGETTSLKDFELEINNE